MRFLARFLQLLGLLICGSGLFIGLYEEKITLELQVASVGAVLFLLGWMLQKRLGS